MSSDRGQMRVRAARFAWIGAVVVAAGWGAAAARAQETPASGAGVPAEPGLTLEQCLATALERNPSYGQAQERVQVAEGDYGLARSAMLPRLTAFSNVDRYERENTYYNPVTGAFDITNRYYSANLSLRQNLFSGGQNRKDVKAADANVDAAREGQRDARLATILQVKEAYLNLLRAEHLLRVSEETLQASRHRQERVEALFNVGSVARADVLQNRVQLAEDELALISQQNQVEIARATLASAMGQPADRPLRVQDVPVNEETPLPDLAQIMEEARRQNPQLGDVRGQLESSRARHSAAKGARYPSIDLGWNYRWQNHKLPGASSDWTNNDNWTASLSVSYDIFDGLATRSRIVSARHGMRQAENLYTERELAILLDVKRQHSSVQESAKRIRVAGESVAAAQERLRLEEERYRLGAATLLQLIEAQVDLTRARTSEVEARYDYALAQARLQRAVGRES